MTCIGDRVTLPPAAANTRAAIRKFNCSNGACLSPAIQRNSRTVCHYERLNGRMAPTQSSLLSTWWSSCVRNEKLCVCPNPQRPWDFGVQWMAMNLRTLVQDLAFGLRLLLKSPAFAIAGILTIAVGVGGTTGIFSIVNSVLLQPLPYRNADQLLSLSGTDKERGLTGINVSFTKLERLQQNARTLQSVAGYFPTVVSFKSSTLPEQLQAAQVSGQFFDVFGVTPEMGRTFLPPEDAPGGASVGIVSNRFWSTRLDADPNVLGRSISIDGNAMTIVGILPAGFHLSFQQPEPDVWLPRVFDNATLGPTRVRSGAGFMLVFARSHPNASLSAVQSELTTIDAAYRRDNPGFADTPEELIAQPLKEGVVGQIRPSLLVLLAAIACVLLIGCSNLMNLLLAKATTRSKELAIRTAMGASRRRLLQQLLTESILLSLIGGTLGLFIALGIRSLVRALPPGTLPRAEEIHFTPAIILFAVVLTLGSGLFFGLLPALRASSANIHESLKEGSRGTSLGRRSKRTSVIAVAAEVALAVLLLGDAGVLVKSFGKLAGIDPGFDPNHVLTMSVPLPPERYSVDKQRQFFRQLLDSVRKLPKVQAAAAVNALPLVGVSPYIYCCPEGLACKGIGRDPLISTRQVTPDYFRAMGIPLLRGRMFQESDNEQTQPVAIINETAAKVFFHGQDPIGKWVANSRDMVRLPIVGVVKDVRFAALNTPAFQEVYTPHTQSPRLFPAMTLVVRTDSSTRPLADAIKRKVAEMDPDIPVANITTMNEAVWGSISQPRLTMQIGSLFALLALLLTVFGIYGVLAYSVSQQTQEIGIRMALGATPAQVIGQVMSNGMRIVIAGMVAGLIAFFASTRLLQGLLFGVSAKDPISLLATTSAILIVGLLASYIPARRAARVSPVSAIAVKL